MRSTHTLANAIHAARLGATVAVTALRHPGETLVLTWGRKGISVVGASGTIDVVEVPFIWPAPGAARIHS